MKKGVVGEAGSAGWHACRWMRFDGLQGLLLGFLHVCSQGRRKSILRLLVRELGSSVLTFFGTSCIDEEMSESGYLERSVDVSWPMSASITAGFLLYPWSLAQGEALGHKGDGGGDFGLVYTVWLCLGASC